MAVATNIFNNKRVQIRLLVKTLIELRMAQAARVAAATAAASAIDHSLGPTHHHHQQANRPSLVEAASLHPPP